MRPTKGLFSQFMQIQKTSKTMIGQEIAKRLTISGMVIFYSSPATADAIDCDWCSPNEAVYVRISGDNISSSTGHQTTGNYSRHAFSYVVPEGYPDASEQFSMQLLNEEQANVSVNGGGVEMWHRCQLNV